MYRSLLLALALVATTWIPVHAQVLPLEPGDRVRIESEDLSGEFTVAAVQAETLSLQVYTREALNKTGVVSWYETTGEL